MKKKKLFSIKTKAISFFAPQDWCLQFRQNGYPQTEDSLTRELHPKDPDSARKPLQDKHHTVSPISFGKFIHIPSTHFILQCSETPLPHTIEKREVDQPLFCLLDRTLPHLD
ncbi:MAG TPA: hypothetical protein O0W91_01975 [Methanocorpusculum sp.]|nr:hypothetical protein [Methanocorpusculum sp.]